MAFYAGLFHDIGKYQASFQKRISGDATVKVEHSTCGAVALKDYFKKTEIEYWILSYIIAGHHTGIPNGGNVTDDKDSISLNGRLKRTFEPFDVFKQDLSIPEYPNGSLNEWIKQDITPTELIEKISFLIRYLFSCLTDADSIDTARFYHQECEEKLHADFNTCLDILNEKLSLFKPKTDLQKARNILQAQAFRNIKQNSEIYLLNMPTGSGKTLCGLKSALLRIKEDSSKKRIIYVIPYNSIIEQTVKVFENAFGGSMDILQHHSSYSYDEDTYEKQTAIKSALENWDAPVIVTTVVQFFESIYDHKRNKLRKLHNIADSILVFDEIHLLPEEYLQPCLQGIAFICKYLNSQAIFLTATMPDFNELFKRYALKTSSITDLVPDKTDFKIFEKCTYVDLNELSTEELILRSEKSPSSLIIVNKRKTARDIYTNLSGERYHLSTYMTSMDRKKTIQTITERLKKLEEDYPDFKDVPEERKIHVVSTSLIEAGVDLDFYTVYRELAGLDNILQAGGRCNREGKRKNAMVYIFRLEELQGGPITLKQQYSNENLIAFSNISSPESIECYYKKLYSTNNPNIESHRLKCTGIQGIPFQTYAENFRLIQENISVVAAENEESALLIEDLKGGNVNFRSLQKYTLSIYQNELDLLIQQNVVGNYNGIWYLTNSDYYDPEIGILFEGKDYII